MEVRPIDANALVAEQCGQCDGACEMFDEEKCLSCKADFHCDLREAIDNAPTLDCAPVRHGEWVEEIEPNVVTASGRDVHLWRCSVCGFSWANKHHVMSYYKHCPNCGAKMDAKEDT